VDTLKREAESTFGASRLWAAELAVLEELDGTKGASEPASSCRSFFSTVGARLYRFSAGLSPGKWTSSSPAKARVEWRIVQSSSKKATNLKDAILVDEEG